MTTDNFAFFAGFSAPSFTQIPDELLDQIMADLSGAELRVMLYICRRTFGFRRDSAKISSRQMLFGSFGPDGVQHDKGTGIHRRATLVETLNGLRKKGLIIVSGTAGEAQYFRLRLQGEPVDGCTESVQVQNLVAGGGDTETVSGGDTETAPGVIRKPRHHKTDSIDKQKRQTDGGPSPLGNDQKPYTLTSPEEEPTGKSDHPKKKKNATAPKAKRLPEGYEFRRDPIQVATEFGVDEEMARWEFGKFQDYEFRTAKTDWDAAWRNWARTTAERKGGEFRRRPGLPKTVADLLERNSQRAYGGRR
jgi:hypothetical protein